MPQTHQKRSLSRYLESTLAAANALAGVLALVVILVGALTGLVGAFASNPNPVSPEALPGRVGQ